jgi:hypothetical protein
MKNIKEFSKFSESLKLNQKAEFLDDKGDNLISKFYTDLFPNNAVNDKVNLSNTTILIGRKGTGKSTIFQKSMKDQFSKKNVLPIYLDVKTIYDRATPVLNYDDNIYISKDELTKYLLYKNFIKEIILEIKNKVEKHLHFNILEQVFGLEFEKIKSIQIELNNIEKELDNVFRKIDIGLFTNIGHQLEITTTNSSGVSAQISKAPKLSGEIKKNQQQKVKEELNSIFLNFLDIKSLLIDNLFRIKEIIGIRHLYIYLDDFSEID